MLKLKNFLTKHSHVIIYTLFLFVVTLLFCLSFLIGYIKNNYLEIKDDAQIVKDNYECEYTNNVGYTECLLDSLDRASAEREWKQIKIETIKHPEINIYNFDVDLVSEQKKIKEWRTSFEEMRDKWCAATNTFVNGSGTPSSIAICRLDIERQAIKQLNYIYYQVIKKDTYSDGISDFEPTNLDINKIIENNTTKRGAVWAGENNETPVVLTYNKVMDSKFGEAKNVDFLKSSYDGAEIKWHAKISNHYSQITGIKFCIIDNEHKNVNIDEPCDLFWAFSEKLMGADDKDINPEWNGQWVDYILNYYKVTFNKDGNFYDDIYTVTGVINGFDCGIAEKCVPNIDIINIKKD